EVINSVIDYIKNVMEDVFGVLLKVEVQVGNMTTELIEFLLELRREARDNKDWSFSDKVRDRLLEMGIKIKDGKEKTTWSI
ncbi:MAG: CysS/YqeB C-terminal domain-containing protein, partial [Cetobacterium sp.]